MNVRLPGTWISRKCNTGRHYECWSCACTCHPPPEIALTRR